MATLKPAGEDRAATLPEPLGRYRSSRVTIYYTMSSGVSDTGTITYMDDRWVELTKNNNERLLIPINAIRIIKALEDRSLVGVGDENVLLRPAEEQGVKAIEE
ncbi:MAG TPA: hypothetical protein VKU00_00805 [Chthonomonadaceae bacterium]|nr:hypothetical protein [Chthonomonadaceae bacterium]